MTPAHTHPALAIISPDDVVDESVFQSPEAFSMFLGVRKTNENQHIDVKKIIHQQIIALRNAYQHHLNWRDVIDDEDDDDLMSAFDIFKLQRICKYLSHVLIHCINHCHNNMTEITKIVIDEINKHEAYKFEGYEDDDVSNARFTISRGNTLMKYYNDFKHTGYFFKPSTTFKNKIRLTTNIRRES